MPLPRADLNQIKRSRRVTRPTGRDAVVLLHPTAARGKPPCTGPGCARLALQRRRSSGGGWAWWCVSCDPGRASCASKAGVAHV